MAEHSDLSSPEIIDDESDEVAGDAPRRRRGPMAWWRAATHASRVVAVLAGALLVAGIGVVVWFGLSATVGKAAWRDLAYDVRDAGTVVVRFELTKPRQMSARCVIEAKEVGHATVGRTEVVIGPSPESTTRHDVTVKTTSLAVIGQVRTCREF